MLKKLNRDVPWYFRVGKLIFCSALMATLAASCWGGGDGETITPALPGVAYFMGNDGTHGRELWKTDGTAAGTVMVKDINPGAGDGFILPFIGLNSAFYFSATDGITGYELWKTDGTEAGTVIVKDIYPGWDSSAPLPFTILDDVFYFRATDGTSGYELWKTDGTAAGTMMVKDINPGAGDGVSNEYFGP